MFDPGRGEAERGGFWDWANKIDNLGKRKCTNSETGIGYYIDDEGNNLGYYPIIAIAPTLGKGGLNFIKWSKVMKSKDIGKM